MGRRLIGVSFALVSSQDSAQRRGALWTAVAVAGLVLLALFLRSYWNFGVAHPGPGVYVLSGGSDPYYHERSISCIMNGGCSPGDQPWSQFLKDPLLNYPYGSINPNPPLYDWAVATTAAGISDVSGMHLTDSMWLTLLFAPAVLGALTTIPMYFLGKEMWSRKAGLIAAFFWAVGASAIDQSSLGDSTHYAAFLFFIALAMLFYVKMLNALRGSGTLVQSWSNRKSVADGMGRLAHDRGLALTYAALSGMSVAAVALVWKGFPYVLGIMFLYGTLQLLLDHWRSRESVGIFVGTLIVFAVGLYAALPYYLGAGILSFLLPSLYMFLAWIVVGLVLVPTRDLPSIVVMPAFVIIGILGILVVYEFFPAVWKSAFFATTYFQQTALYQTIAEAHPADFDAISFGIGPVIATLAVIGAGWILVRMRRAANWAHTFALVWLVVAIYMANSATRFLFNAAPAFALVAGVMAARILEWVDFNRMRREMSATSSFWGGWRRGVKARHYVAAVLIVFVLVLPQAVLAFDAATPPTTKTDWQTTQLKNWLESNGYTKTQLQGASLTQLTQLYIQKRLTLSGLPDTADNEQTVLQDWIFFPQDRLGASGQDFLDSSWQASLNFLNNYSNANYSTIERERPAFLAWWDYGHWAISVGHVPTVADNFQEGYQFAANFLLAQNETSSIELMAARTIVCVPTCAAPSQTAQIAAIKAGLPGMNLTDAQAAAILGAAPPKPAAGLLGWKWVNLTEPQAVQLLNAVEEWTGCPSTPRDAGAPPANAETCKRIRFFTVDVRMMPLDDPNQTTIQQPSIFYAPVVLKGDNPDDYVSTIYTGSDNSQYTQTQLNARMADPHQEIISVQKEELQYYAPFFNSMYYRAFVGPSPPNVIPGQPVSAATVLQYYNPQPGFALQHFRTIYADPEIRILEYYPGTTVTGRVVDSTTDKPISGVTVLVYDDANGQSPSIFHMETTTNASGYYTLTAPFSTSSKGVFFEFVKDGTRVGNMTMTAAQGLSHANAETYGSAVTAPTFSVGTGSVQGHVSLDYQNGTINSQANLAGLTFRLGNQNVTVGANGTYGPVNVLAGQATPSTMNATYTFNAAASITVNPNKTTTSNLSVIYRPVNITGQLALKDFPNANFTEGQPPQLAFNVNTTVSKNTGINANTTNGLVTVLENGTFRATVTPGTYTMNLISTYAYKTTANGTALATYSLNQAIVVTPGEAATKLPVIYLTRIT
ncbi:MAG: STT3 domain-containing protein [Thermoplasmatota archaeon]